MPMEQTLPALLRELRRVDYSFVTPTPLTIERVNARPGNAVASDLVGALGWSRPFDLSMLPPAIRQLLASGDLVRQRDDGLFASAIRVSTLGDDLFVHSAYPTLAADAVFFGPDTYRFANAIREHLKTRTAPVTRAVDIGCGAGPGGIVIARERPGADIVMVDINETALRYAAANALAAGLTGVVAARSDLLTGVDGSFDLIVSNPPYLNDALERTYRHGGGAYGEALSVRIAAAALDRLTVGGELVLYTGVAMVAGHDPFLAAVSSLLGDRGVVWKYREVDPDVFGEELDGAAYGSADRIAAVVLTVERRG